MKSGVNPTIMSYNASAVKMYDAANSLMRFENKKQFQFQKRSSLNATLAL
jgi:hypothetical protein